MARATKNSRERAPYSRRVFVNCPYDPTYLPLLRAVVFTIHACGFKPRLAIEEANMGKPRLENIVGLIRECKLGIHDLSRVGARMPDLPRFNMPFECGVFVGAQMFGGPAHASKAFLLLEAKAYRAQRTLSDAAGLDPRVHNNSVKRIVVCVRDFLADHINPRPLGSDHMYSTYQSFAAAYPALARRYGHEARQLKSLETFADWQWIAADWLRARAAIVR